MTVRRTKAPALGLLTLIFCVAFQTAVANEKPTVFVSLNMKPEQVQERSTLRIPWQLIPVGEKGRRGGGVLLNTPHRLIYEDATLRVVLPDAGNAHSMPTSLIIAFDVVDLVSASVLGEYVNLEKAIATSKSLLAEVLAQGFDYGPLDPAKGQSEVSPGPKKYVNASSRSSER
jgi:hypothetical protein